MSKHCVCCSSPIPDDQRVCSMCYGDIDYGRDGHYRRWVEEQEAHRKVELEPESEGADPEPQIMAEMTWKRVPECDGYYWYRSGPGDWGDLAGEELQIVDVWKGEILFSGGEISRQLDEAHGQFWGPLTVPRLGPDPELHD